MSEDSCAHCGDDVSDALARTVRVTVDRSQIDQQRLCPTCFADWIDRYESEMQPEEQTVVDDENIIVD
ncbi:DUF7569 family protein [Salarchaeum japonicum]|uniref:DUF7569 family protein n=1 Tax=Salarchaeum japonicum TaxID=555573 RepID=UPI003C71AB5E